MTHRPVRGILEGKQREFDVENATYAASSGSSFKADYAVVLSGHIHVAESIAFDETSERPPQLISGNAGTALDDIPTASPTAGELGDPAVAEAETLSAFGFMTIEPDGDVWIATQRDKNGNQLLGCVLDVDRTALPAAGATERSTRREGTTCKEGDLSVAPLAPSPDRDSPARISSPCRPASPGQQPTSLPACR